MHSPHSHHIERNVMTQTNITQDQFDAAQARLATFLEEKYNIKKQSNGLMEFGAAFILGFDNHHALNAQLAEQQTSMEQSNIYNNMDDDDFIIAIFRDSECRDFVLGNRPSADFTDKEVNDFIFERFEIKPSRLTSFITAYTKAIFNQVAGFTIKFYDSKEAFDKRKDEGVLHNCDDRQGGYAYFADAMIACYNIINSDEGRKPNFYGIEVFDDEHEVEESYTYEELVGGFKMFEDKKELEQFYINHLKVNLKK